MKTYRYLSKGHIVQARDGIGGTGIVREQTGPGYRYKVWFHTGERFVHARDIGAVGPQLGTIKLHAAKVEG